jgi:hypothetical protein
MPFLPEKRRSPHVREAPDGALPRRRRSPTLEEPATDKVQYQTSRQVAPNCVPFERESLDFAGLQSPHSVLYTNQQTTLSDTGRYVTSRSQQYSIPGEISADAKPRLYIHSGNSTDKRNVSGRPTTLLILGLTGVGKSAFISSLLAGSAMAPTVGQSLQSCTKDVTKYNCTVGGADFDLIDTPGFDDSYRSEMEVLQSISDYLVRHVQSGGYVDGVMFLHRIIDVRLSASAIRVADLVKRICGKDFYPYTALVTNMWQSLPSRRMGVARLHELLNHPKFWRDFDEAFAPHYRLSRTKDSAEKIVGEFQWYLAQHGRIPSLQIVDELISQRLPLTMTSAGDLLEGELWRRKFRYEEEVARIEEEIQKTPDDRSGSSDHRHSRYTGEQQSFATPRSHLLSGRNRDQVMNRSMSEGILGDPTITRDYRPDDGTISDGHKAGLKDNSSGRPDPSRTRSATNLAGLQHDERRAAADEPDSVSHSVRPKLALRQARDGELEVPRQRSYHKTWKSISFDDDNEVGDWLWPSVQCPSCSAQVRFTQVPVRRRYMVSS